MEGLKSLLNSPDTTDRQIQDIEDKLVIQQITSDNPKITEALSIINERKKERNKDQVDTARYFAEYNV